MRRYFLLLLICCKSNFSNAQDLKSITQRTPVKSWYAMNSGEFIFSAGELKISDKAVYDPFGSINTITEPDNIIRFSAFFHTSQELHYNFSNVFGFYTGLAIRNVGFINTMKVGGEKLTLKQRSYSLGIPVAVKIGNMQTYFLTAGIEPEIMFAYKRKIFFDGDKSKKSQWFSNDVNVFNPSLFAQINFKGGFYIKAKYYLNDFLTSNQESFNLPDKPVSVSYKVDSRKLFYVSIGTSIKNRKIKMKKPIQTSVAI